MSTKSVVDTTALEPLTFAVTWLDRFLGTLLVTSVTVAVFDPIPTVNGTEF